jgi:flagellar hook protein FlgE
MADNGNLNLGLHHAGAKGQSAAADSGLRFTFGVPLNVRVTAVMESRTGTATTYRWFAGLPPTPIR